MDSESKVYDYSFLLEPTKLTQIVENIHAQMPEDDGVSVRDSFIVYQTGNKENKFSSLSDVIKTDNSRRYRVRRLLISSSATELRTGMLKHEIQVDFGKKINSASTGNSQKSVIEILVRGESAVWNNRALASVEEQVERTKSQYAMPIVTLVSILILALFLSLSQISVAQHNTFADTMWLKKSDLSFVKKVLESNAPLSESEERELITRQLHNVMDDQKALEPVKPKTRNLILFGLPLVFIIICAVLVLFCYPRAVFLWGDEVARHQSRLELRKVFWVGVFLSVIVSVIVSLFSAGLLEALAAV